MKTAQEWRDELNGGIALSDKGVIHIPYRSLEKVISAIQADAYRAGLLRAAELCRQLIKLGYVSAGKAAKAIEAEAQKGQP